MTLSLPVNSDRLARAFVQLCEIDSPSLQERAVCDFLKVSFARLGAATIFEDDSGRRTGSNCGNLIISFDGRGALQNEEPIFFACHMDTVEPGRGIKVIRTGDIFTSRDDTVLGGDDKSGIAALIELIYLLVETKTEHGPFELLLTTGEEIGLLGAKALDPAQIKASYGYALDSTGIDRIIIGAPAANKITIEIRGRAAHAGLHPEQGLSALCVAATAIGRLRLGRLDEESTANLGRIQGGTATNIIPERVVIEGEVRSHCPQKLAAHTEQIRQVFQQTVDGWPSPPDLQVRPVLSYTVHPEYPALRLNSDDPALIRIKRAEMALGRPLEYQIAGGGSDANIFNSFGLPTAIIATGMDQVHTSDEQLDLNDLIRLTELLFAIMTSSTATSA
jgi:tripeptide aminopeptidase